MRTPLAPAPGPVLGSDPHDFAGLYIRHRSSFTSHARRYLRDPRDADEVVQEAFLRLFLAMPELETELQALAYCRRTITNLCIDRYRADARRPRLVALEGAPVDELAEDDTGDPVVRAEDAALVREALSKLPELHRAALVMREIEEKPLPVIADELDVAEDSVKHLLFRARRTLRKLLAGTSVAPGVDAERTRGLRPVARGASGGAAGLLLLALLGLGSGPDLRAVPVVGVDLPDVLGVTAVADAVSGAVRDVVGAIGGSRGTDATAASQQPPSRAAGPSDALPGTDGPAPTGADGASTGPTGSAPARPGAAEGRVPGAVAQPGRPGQPVGAAPPTTVTGVGGLPVVGLLPPTGSLPSAASATSVRPLLPEASVGRGPGPLPAGPPTSGGAVRGLPAGTPSSGVDQPVRASGPGTSGRSPRADDAAQRADEAVARAAERAEQATQKAAGRAADVADKAQEQAVRTAERAADKAGKAADRAADRTDRAADRAEQAAEKSAAKADQAARKADRAAQVEAARAAEAAEKATARAAERAAARAAADRAAAERAAARAAALAAAQAAELAAAQAAERAAAAAAAERAAAAAAAEQAAAAAVPVAPVAAVPAP